MDSLNMAIALLLDAKDEREKLQKYEQEYCKAEILDHAIGVYAFDNRSAVDKKFSPIPRKAQINNRITLARRYLLSAYKE